MKVQVETISSVKKKLSISVPEEEVRKEFEDAYRNLGQRIRIPGFRPGKAPRSLLEKRFGSAVESEVYEALVRKTIMQAVQDQQLDVVSVSEIQEPQRKEGEGFQYVASVEVKPEIEPKNYSGVKVKETIETVKPEQVDAVLQRLQEEQGVLRDREGATSLMNGDYAFFELQPTDAQGHPISGKESVPQLQPIGKSALPKRLEEALMKLEIGSSTVAPLSVSHAEHKPESESKEEFFRVTLKGIKEKSLPPLNDEFARSVGSFENLKILKEKVTSDLSAELKEKTRSETAQKIIAKIVEENPLDVPDSMVGTETSLLLEGFLRELRLAGIQQLPKDQSEEQLREKLRPDAVRRVHEKLLLEAIAKKEHIHVEESDISERLGQIALTAKVPVAELRAHYEKTGRIESLRFQLLAQKTLDFLLSKANIK